MLTVGKEAVLSMNVSKGGGYNHTVSGVLTCEGTPVSGKQVEAKVNGTVEAVVTALSDGSYSVTLNLKAVDNKPTNYQIETAYYGDSALNLTALDTLPNGTQYTVCTTLQYFSYKPAANATFLTVEPITTQASKNDATPPPIAVWPEFSWWPPWFKLVAEVNVPFDTGVTKFRFELMPLVFQQTAYVASGEDALVDALIKIVAAVGVEAIVGYLIGSFIVPRIATHIACSSMFNVLAVVLLYAGIQMLVAFALNRVFGKTGIVISIGSFFLSAVISAFMAGLSVISDWVQAVYRGATGQIKSIWHSWWGRSLGFVNIVEAMAFFFVDVGLGAFLTTLL
jgi:cobalamin biosynthesis Mg chelatase CobN